MGEDLTPGKPCVPLRRELLESFSADAWHVGFHRKAEFGLKVGEVPVALREAS
jgi:hypothetical protein